MGRIAGVTAVQTRERLLRVPPPTSSPSAGMTARELPTSRGDWLAELMRLAQERGEPDAALSPGVLAHFCLLLAMGSALVAPDLHPVDDDGWTALLSRIVSALARTDITAQSGGNTVKVQIDSGRCQGHGRCYDRSPDLFGEDDEGYGTVLNDGVVPPGKEHDARLAASNCPECAIDVLEEA